MQQVSIRIGTYLIQRNDNTMNKKATKGYYIKQSNQKRLEKYGALLDIPHCKPSASLYLDILLDEHFAALEKKEAKKAPAAELATLDVENLNVEAWDKWLAYRKLAKLKAYKTNATLGNYEEQMQIVMISINNEYAGLFPLKNNSQSNVDILQKSSDSDWHLQDQGF